MKKRCGFIVLLLFILMILLDISGVGFEIKHQISGCYGMNSLGKISRRIDAFGDCKIPFLCTIDENRDKVIVLVDNGTQVKISGFSDTDYKNEFIRFKDKLERKYKNAVELRQENICTDDSLPEYE